MDLPGLLDFTEESHGPISPSFEFDDPLFTNVKHRKTPPLTQEEIEDTAEAIKRLHQELDHGYTTRHSLLSDLGLAYKDTNPRVEHRHSTELVSIVHKVDPSFLPKMELWEIVNDECNQSILDPMEDWPARLLHVPSMTSLEWQPESWYGDVKEPSYAILSYTWGRWRLLSDAQPPHPALSISGITWKVPPVNPELFSVHEFQKTIQRISHEAGTDFVWVDVACIDQNEGSVTGAREIGRQAKIFKTASEAFIWLLEERSQKDQASIGSLFQIIEAASVAADAAHRQWFLEYALPALSNEPQNLNTYQQFMREMEDSWIFNIGSSVNSVTRMPWFSSLWTLQEAFLKPAAKFIDRNGRLAMSQNIRPYELQDILAYCKQIYQLFPGTPTYRHSNRASSEDDEREVFMVERALVRTIERSGLQALADRDRTTMYACANLRQTSFPEDRVYGIMQIWNFQLGKASLGAEPTQIWTLEQLECGLGQLLIQSFPIESQLQVHMSSAKGRQAWRISQHSATPIHNLYSSHSGHLEGTIDRLNSKLGVRLAGGTMYAYFRGKSCSFTSLLEAWSFISKHDSAGTEKKYQPSPVRISLDESVVLNGVILQAKHSLQNVPDAKQIELAEQINKLFEELDRRISLLLLGQVSQNRHGVIQTTIVGVLVMDAPDKLIGGWQKRLGICLWDALPAGGTKEYRAAIDVLSGDAKNWNETECIFG